MPKMGGLGGSINWIDVLLQVAFLVIMITITINLYYWLQGVN